MTKSMVDDLMVQEQIKAPYKRWKHMVGVMCLNLTYRKHVKIILPKLFKRYPNPRAYLRGRLATQQQMLLNILSAEKSIFIHYKNKQLTKDKKNVKQIRRLATNS